MSDERRWGADVVVGGDDLTLVALVAMTHGLVEVFPDARLSGGPDGLFAIRLGEMTEDLPEWME